MSDIDTDTGEECYEPGPDDCLPEGTVSDEQRLALEAERAHARAERAAWLEQRRTGIGGSDIAALAGLDKWGSPWSVYHDKVGSPMPDYAGEEAEWGLALEQLIAERWRRRHQPAAALYRPGLLRGATPWHVGTPDFAVVDEGHLAAGLEVKNPGYMAWVHTWQGGAEIPPYIDCQCQWYAELLDVETVHLAALVNGNHLERFDVRRNRNAFALLADIADRFWNEHVLAGTPPAPDGGARARRQLDDLYPPREGIVAVTLPPDAAQVAADYARWRDVAAAAEDARAAAGHQLIAWLGEQGATDGYVDGDLLVTYRPARAIDLAALAVEHPDAVADATRSRVDVKALRKALGAKRLAPFQHPGEQRRLNVRST